MTSLKYKSLWKIMSQYVFEVEPDVPDIVKCCLCSQLLVEPYISPCGCQSCEKCIKKYLIENNIFCPGKKKECKEEMLQFDDNVVKDYRASQVIAKVVVKCPYNLCEVRTQLENIESHISICTKEPIKCPFISVGCEREGLLEENVNDHLHTDMIIHSKLLVEYMSHLRNDINGLNKDVVTKDGVIHKLKEVIEINAKEIKEMNLIVNKLSIERELDKIELHAQRKEIAECQEEQQQLYTFLNMLQQTILKKECLSVTSTEDMEKDEHMKIQLHEKMIFSYKAIIDNFKRLKEDKSKSPTNIRNGIYRWNENDVNNIQMKELNAFYDFIWKFERISEMREGSYDSDVFYKNNFKYCLRFIFDHEDLGLYLCFIKGEMEIPARWSKSNTVSLYFINQETMSIHTYNNDNCDNCKGINSKTHKPNNITETTISGQWISINSLKTIRGLVVEDSILVCCTIK